MIAQDPYPQPNYATGIAFANPPDTSKISPSLELIKDRIYKDFYLPEDYNTFDCTLHNWVSQGMLLINSSLSVRKYQPGSHSLIWRPFMAELLKNLSNYYNGIVYLLVGRPAAELEVYINHKSNYVFKYYHPAYYSRIGSEMKCDGFLKATEIIKNNYNYGIIW